MCVGVGVCVYYMLVRKGWRSKCITSRFVVGYGSWSCHREYLLLSFSEPTNLLNKKG